MEITLLTISKQCSDIINTCPLELRLDLCIITELYGKIYDLYPTLDTTKYNLYWRYNKDTFYPIFDYLSYTTVLTLMVDKTLFLVLNDCDQHWDDNEGYLRWLDEKELREQRERERDIYDIKILRKGEEESQCGEYIEHETPAKPRTNSQIITYAIRKLPETNFYTSDLIFKSETIKGVKKGWPKLKNKLTEMKEEVIERAIEKASKKDVRVKGGAKDKKKKK